MEEKYDIILDEYVIMPDHVHFLIFIKSERATARVAPTLGRIVGAYKSIVANEWRKICKNRNESCDKLWQRNYYEHIIRNRQDFEEIKKYIFYNPEKTFLKKV
ncbi:MAG: transposase [Oscillospiraceae bacterium]|nr:transposase [Oscillospiraceae bacterium]